MGEARAVKREHVLIDGYNLLHAHPRHGAIVAGDIDAARARLVSDLAGYAQGGPRTIVVFDGAGNPASDGTPHHLGALTVIFSPSGVTADATIEGLARRFRDKGERVLVVTSDVATRETVRSGEVSVRSSASFAEELEQRGQADRDAAHATNRVPMAHRIAPDVSAALDRWAKGTPPGSQHKP
jgi:predicted RNA-binding protein with PIN domain